MFAVAANNVPTGLVDFFHGIQVAITFALMTNVVQFAWHSRKKKRGMSHCEKYGPVYILMVSTCLVMVQPTCMLVISSWGIDNFFFDGGNTNALVPNTTTGWLIQVFCTYVGYILLFIGVFWTTQLHQKIYKQWIRNRGLSRNLQKAAGKGSVEIKVAG